MSTEIEEQVHRIVRRQTGREKDETTSLDSSLADDLKMDSLDLLEVVIDIEGEHNIVVDNDELGGVVTVRDLARLVERAIDKAKPNGK